MTKKPDPWSWRDAARSPFEKSRAVELRYARTLRKIASEVQRIIDGFGDPLDDPAIAYRIDDALAKYGQLLEPWAASVGARMVVEVNQQDEAAWNRLSRSMSVSLRSELAGANIGVPVREALARQVSLIKSLPTQAGQRVHELTLKGITQGTRASEIATMIARSGEVTASRATLIARTEVSRTSTELTKARAITVGSSGYVWRTSRDADVRPSHRRMEGQLVQWDSPPTLDGLVGHAGCLPNCRCWTQVVLPQMGHNQGPAFFAA